MNELPTLEPHLRSVRLVVLSACDSMVGKLSSDGMIGISRAFVAAGTSSLIASLWKVQDHATNVLMQRFYHHFLCAGPTQGDASTALQAAMVSMLRQGNFDVLSWAPFCVFGLATQPREAAANETRSPAFATENGSVAARVRARVQQLFAQLVSSGISPNEAAVQALAQASAERH